MKIETPSKNYHSDYGYDVLELEIMPDHVQLIVAVNPLIGIYKIETFVSGS